MAAMKKDPAVGMGGKKKAPPSSDAGKKKGKGKVPSKSDMGKKKGACKTGR